MATAVAVSLPTFFLFVYLFVLAQLIIKLNNLSNILFNGGNNVRPGLFRRYFPRITV